MVMVGGLVVVFCEKNDTGGQKQTLIYTSLFNDNFARYCLFDLFAKCYDQFTWSSLSRTPTHTESRCVNNAENQKNL